MAGRHFVRRGGAKRLTDWSGSAVLTGDIAVAVSTSQLLETFVPIGSGETLIRTRGLFGWRSDQSAADETQIGAMGIGVVSAQAVSVGATAIPAPATDVDWDGWLYHTFFYSHLDFLSAVGMEPNVAHVIMIDSKAMRKVSTDERLVVMVENTSGSGGIRVATNLRLLSKAF